MGFAATRVFADEELERLRGFPEISWEKLFRHFTLAPADIAFVAPGRGRGALRRTIYAAKYPDYRRRIARQLNKGESRYAATCSTPTRT